MEQLKLLLYGNCWIDEAYPLDLIYRDPKGFAEENQLEVLPKEEGCCTPGMYVWVLSIFHS